MPSAAELLAADPQVLRDSGFSARKGNTLRELAQRFVDGRLSDTALARMSDEEVEAALTEVPGIGLWSARGFLLVALNLHLELARRRPAAGRLTEFYLWVSLGGVLGGLFNSLVAPLVRADERRPYFGQTMIYLLFAGACAGAALYAFGPWVAGVLNNPELGDQTGQLR